MFHLHMRWKVIAHAALLIGLGMLAYQEGNPIAPTALGIGLLFAAFALLPPGGRRG